MREQRQPAWLICLFVPGGIARAQVAQQKVGQAELGHQPGGHRGLLDSRPQFGDVHRADQDLATLQGRRQFGEAAHRPKKSARTPNTTSAVGVAPAPRAAMYNARMNACWAAARTLGEQLLELVDDHDYPPAGQETFVAAGIRTVVQHRGEDCGIGQQASL